ncbi:MAG: GTPase/DUF3482 domain-containing protein [Desulfobacteraceae bacterium]
MTMPEMPEFAVLGHPNEGKSSVVSTLAEDDTVRIGPFPGETVKCRRFPVKIDSREIIRFVDTPGFQMPRQTLSWMKTYSGPDTEMVADFIKAHQDDPDFRDECELLSPLVTGAGIIYVVNGSRPVRNDDKTEMEILRLTGMPRMAVINCKTDAADFLDEWKSEFRKHFNCLRIFNAQKATYQERIELLETLKNVDQDYAPALSRVIQAFREDWHQREKASSRIIVEMVETILALELSQTIRQGEDEEKVKARLEKKYRQRIETMESQSFDRLRALFKHNIFHCELPENSILNQALFSEKTWQFLGLNPGELAVAAGVAGGAAGAVIDTAAAGLTFGIFSALGGLAGAGSVLVGGKRISDLRFKGMRLGRDQLKIGPASNIQLMYILLDRSLIFYSLVINWAHALRDTPGKEVQADVSKNLKKGVTTLWDRKTKQACARFFGDVKGDKKKNLPSSKEQMTTIVLEAIKRISS